MFCSKCAGEIVYDDSVFYSKRGFALKSVGKPMENNVQNEDSGDLSQFQKSIRLGIKLLLLALILIPAFQILGGFFVPEDVLIESLPSSSWFVFLGNAVLITLFLAGAARIFYAIVFERSTQTKDFKTNSLKEISGKLKNALPPSQSTRVSDFGKWKTTDELFEPVFSKPKTSGELK